MKRALVLLLGASVLLGCAAGVAFATGAISLGDDTIYGCAQKNNGQFRIVSDPSECRNSERPVSFNQQGPAGPPGPPGASVGDTPAYAHVLADGTLDATQSKNVVGVLRLPEAVAGDGVYCFDLAAPVRNVVATSQINAAVIGTPGYALVSPRAAVPAIPQCPAPYTDATVSMLLEEQYNTSPQQFSTAFYVAFNN
jgi:hypothetical protein